MLKKKVTKVKKANAEEGKKDVKQESKAEKESDIEGARTNAAIWELRLKTTETSLAECTKSCYKLGLANQQLTDQLYHTEKDSLAVTASLYRKTDAQAEEIIMLQKSLKTQELLAREEKNKLTEDYTLQINEMKELLRKKSSDFDRIQEEIFQMEHELKDMRESKDAAEKAYRENLKQMEHKFSEEKAQLEREAEERKVVPEKACNEAMQSAEIPRLSELSDALEYLMKEVKELEKEKISLAEENVSLAVDKNTLESIAKKNVAQIETQKKQLIQLRAKVESLEVKVKKSVRELEREREKTQVVTQASQIELEKLQKVLAMRERELAHIKRLAGTIVEQHTELSQFFHDALHHVRQEITASRLQHKKEAEKDYRWRMRETTAGRLKFPPIRTFHQCPPSTNSVCTDMEAAAWWGHLPGSKVQISDLTWEQKEQVLSLLFAKMNERATRKVSNPLTLSASSEKSHIDSDAAGIKEEQSPATFNTEMPEPTLPPNPNSPPDMHTT
ncbi:basal body-orientation factor 1-like [Cheilinus undulatus]|uniref:basal body-orientation factor 1-like n=1 Tax=Cheilinus undulatus TaxID=241271 RepID=UPI001BD5F1A8|nr:basal body-orientation factor 1-like [Cheilinus undulatus]